MSDCQKPLPGAPVIGFSDLLCRLGVTPYFQNHRCAVLHGDCREIMAKMKPKIFGCLLTDPPYGVGFVSNNRKESWGAIVGDDDSLDVMKCLDLALTRCTDGAHWYVFGPWNLAELRKSPTVELIWDKIKMSGGDLGCAWGLAHERITFGTNARFKSQMGRGGIAARKRRGTVLRVRAQQGNECDNHPTEKPVELLRQLIESSTIMDESILDPFVGSGSTLVAAQMEGRYAVGIEYEERHCETAAKRLEELGAW
jgi:site-specific DNA-methyltransferase (adenine-specific)